MIALNCNNSTTVWSDKVPLDTVTVYTLSFTPNYVWCLGLLLSGTIDIIPGTFRNSNLVLTDSPQPGSRVGGVLHYSSGSCLESRRDSISLRIFDVPTRVATCRSSVLMVL